MNSTEKNIISRFLLFRAKIAHDRGDDDTAKCLAKIGSEVLEQRDGVAAFDKEFFDRVDKISALVDERFRPKKSMTEKLMEEFSDLFKT